MKLKLNPITGKLDLVSTATSSGDSCGLDPINKTDDMTNPVGKDSSGKLYTAPCESIEVEEVEELCNN